MSAGLLALATAVLLYCAVWIEEWHLSRRERAQDFDEWRRTQFEVIAQAQAARLRSVGAWGTNGVVTDEVWYDSKARGSAEPSAWPSGRGVSPRAAVLLRCCHHWRGRRLL